jgi:hypothetical protein
MESCAIHKAMTCTEEQGGVIRRKTSMTVDSYRYGCREDRALIRGIPMGVMVI